MKTMFRALTILVAILVVVGIMFTHITIKVTRYEDVHWQGNGTTHATVHKTETKLLGGEVIKDETYKVHWYEDFGTFFDSNAEGVRGIELSFR